MKPTDSFMPIWITKYGWESITFLFLTGARSPSEIKIPILLVEKLGFVTLFFTLHSKIIIQLTIVAVILLMKAIATYMRKPHILSSKNPFYAVSYLILICLLYTSPSPRDRQKSRMPSSA
eukprot:TRINITY_DN5258_c0_g1_i1.p1 TRINITY_DN5258_c0_g1~~TRINITY_DN5258_c0_g1_i1.p1  ORF type:complete len:120 (-),score=6.79 TRINITY_DN5258_c0_g1_i1:11-370(-)